MSKTVAYEFAREGTGWAMGQLKSVIVEVKCDSWNGFVNFLHDDSGLRENHRYYFRGHSSEQWKLEPTLKRNAKGNDHKQLQAETLSAFKKHCLGRRGHNPAILSEDEWWAVGQHYGLYTPLLDWSESPYVLLFLRLMES